MESLEATLQAEKPDILVLVETQVVGKNCPKIKGYEKIVIRNRKSKGGGILLAVRKGTNIDLITTHTDDVNEQIWTKVTTPGGDFILAALYGLHESKATDEEIEDWYFALDKQYSQHGDDPVILLGDLNAHVGNDLEGIPGNHSKINKNGNKLRDFIDRRNLTLVNSMELCKGKWTRQDKRSGNKTIIDLVIVNEDMQPKLKSMNIDEERLITPARFIKRNGKSEEVQSDHNCITIEISGNPGISRNKITRWNLRNEKSLNQFSKITENIVMKESWLTPGDVNFKYKRWHNQVKSVMYQCFNRVTEKNNHSSNLTTKLIEEQKTIKKKIRTLVEHGLQEGVGYQVLNTQLRNKINEIDDNIKNEKSKKLQKRLDSMMQKGHERSNEIWKIRKQAFRPEEQKMAIKDKEGNLLTCKDNIFNRFTEYYQELLKPRPPNPEN